MSVFPLVRHHGDVDVIALRDELDIAASARLCDVLLATTAASQTLVVDLTLVTYLDSGGLRLLDRLVAELERRGAAIAIVAPEGGAALFTLRLAAFRDDLLAQALPEALTRLRSQRP